MNNTYCNRCTFLFLIEGKRPMCLLKAKWVGGALRERVDVRGIMAAEMRNAFNTCTGKRLISIRAVSMKRFMLASLQEEELPLKAYPMVEEQDTTAQYRKRMEETPDEEDTREEEGTDEEFVEDEQIIRPEDEELDGGDDSGGEHGTGLDSAGESGEVKE